VSIHFHNQNRVIGDLGVTLDVRVPARNDAGQETRRSERVIEPKPIPAHRANQYPELHLLSTLTCLAGKHPVAPLGHGKNMIYQPNHNRSTARSLAGAGVLNLR